MGARPRFGEGIGGKRERSPKGHGRREHEESRDNELRQEERTVAYIGRSVEVQEEKREAPPHEEAEEGKYSRGQERLRKSRQRVFCRKTVKKIGREAGP